ncbi:hypothetical protein MAR_022403 [Mya arenaria]|uniref:Uncharacterized protein n=1 Tax=Mya arenaria TaxID=6604 RepID=A0ABY7DSU7_MYAAR|nr:uncharacterized protein LOC128228840 [Mya arenaria]WAQ98030.1 hypothetical protein MAR_022403 [Mya arenaria]
MSLERELEYSLGKEHIPRYNHIAKCATWIDEKSTFFLRKLYIGETSVPIEFGDVTMVFQPKFILKEIESLFGPLQKRPDELLTEYDTAPQETNEFQPKISVTYSQDKNTGDDGYVVKAENEDNMRVRVVSEKKIQEALGSILEKIVLKQFVVKFSRIKQTVNEKQLGQGLADKNSYSIEMNKLNAFERESLVDTIREGQALLRRFGHYEAQINSSPSSTDEKILDAVFGVDGNVKGCGFRDGQLQIHVHKPSIPSERQRIKSELTNVLQNLKINSVVVFGDYDITPFSGSQVGDKAENILGKTGTLGGFAQIEGHLPQSESKLCALFARHFADPDEDNEEPPVQIFHQSGNKTKLGVVHRGNERSKYDISAVAVVSEVENNKFKTSEGLYSPSQLCLYEHDQLANLEELQVYIWANGEATPRRGKIAIPYYRLSSIDGHYVLIETFVSGIEKPTRL